MIFDTPLWEFLEEIIDSNISRTARISGSSVRRTFCKRNEVKQLYGIIMAIENTYGNENRNLRTHLNRLKHRYKENYPQIGMERFIFLRNNLNPTKEQLVILCDMLRERFVNLLAEVN